MSSINSVEQIDETIMDVTQKAEQNGGQIEGVDQTFRKLLREIYEIFQNQLIIVNEEENNSKILTLLKNFCVYNRSFIIFEYSCSSLPNMSSKEMITSIFVLLISEKLFSVFLMYLMSNDSMKLIYRKTAVLMNIDALVSLIKTFQFYENKYVTIVSKWIQHYETMKSSKMKKTSKDLKLDVSESERKDYFYESESAFINQLPENDPIRVWYGNFRNFNLKEFENSVKNTIEKDTKEKLVNLKDKLFLKSKVSVYNDDDVNPDAPAIPNKPAEQVNQLFMAVKKMNEDDSQKDAGSIQSVSFTSINAIPSRLLESKFFDKATGFDLKFLQPPDTNSSKPNTCCDCKTELKKILWMKGGKFCSQENDWFCDNCIHPEKIIIPWKVRLEGDQSI